MYVAGTNRGIVNMIRYENFAQKLRWMNLLALNCFQTAQVARDFRSC